MRSPTGEIIFGGETMRFWDFRGPWLEPLRGPNGLVLKKLKSEESSLVAELEAQKINDPAEIRRVENQAQINKTAADRWTDNIWAIKKFLTKKKGLSGKEVCD